MVHLYGLTRDDFDNKYESWLSAIHPDDVARFTKSVQRTIVGNCPLAIEFQIVLPSNAVRMGRVFGVAQRMEGGLCLSGAYWDITSLNRDAVASYLNLGDVVKKLPVGIYSFRTRADGHDCFEYVSERFCRILGVTAAESLSDPEAVFCNIPEGHRCKFDGAWRDSLREKTPFRWEGRWLSSCGDKWVSIEANPTVAANGDILWDGAVNDLTAIKRDRDELCSLRTAVEQTGNTVVLTNTEGAIEYVNPAFEETTGYSSCEAIGRNPRVLKSGEQDAAFYRDLWATISSGNIWRGEFHNKRKDGTLYWESATLSPVFNENGEIARYVAIKEDITDRKNREAVIKQLVAQQEMICNAVPAMIWYKDTHNTVLRVNRAGADMLGMAIADIEGKSLYDILPRDAEKYYADDCEVIASGTAKLGILEPLLSGNGDERWLLTDKFPQYNEDGTISGIVVFSSDVTERQIMESSLREALRQANLAAETKSAFLAMVSHELRTPLNGVIGFSELLALTSLSDEQKTYVETVLASGEHLLSVVNDILDFSSLEKGGIEIEHENIVLKEFLEAACRPLKKAAFDKGLSFSCSVDPGSFSEVSGDSRRIRQILINLIGNAIKFTEKGGVAVNVSCANDNLVISVADSGIGILPDNVERLFKPFVQADSAINRRFGGTGLGLAISRQLANVMGGDISVSSKPIKGSTFTLRLPCQGRGAVVRADTLLANSGGATILVVDDDPVSRKLAGHILKSIGYQPVLVTNGAEAVAAFEPPYPHAILMDMQMPVMDGLTATKAIRNKEGTACARVPIIALTANAMPGDRELCLAAGMDLFVSKPFKRDALIAVLEGLKR